MTPLFAEATISTDHWDAVALPLLVFRVAVGLARQRVRDLDRGLHTGDLTLLPVLPY